MAALIDPTGATPFSRSKSSLSMQVDHVPTVSDSLTLRHAKGLTLPEATHLLDWLEAHGICQRSVSLEVDGLFSVHWTT